MWWPQEPPYPFPHQNRPGALGVVYHVQTETRKDGRFETVVYRRGEIIHKVTSPSPQQNDSSTDEEVRKVLEEQHRKVIDRIRSGELESPTA